MANSVPMHAEDYLFGLTCHLSFSSFHSDLIVKFKTKTPVTFLHNLRLFSDEHQQHMSPNFDLIAKMTRKTISQAILFPLIMRPPIVFVRIQFHVRFIFSKLQASHCDA